jgi:hypothetical protein
MISQREAMYDGVGFRPGNPPLKILIGDRIPDNRHLRGA